MEVILYTNNSDNKVVTKSLSVQATINGTLREDCSIIDPIITFSDSVINNAIAAVSNYAMIAQFGRYYFINNIVAKGKFWEVHMHVDVLSSFQTQLKALDAVVARQENKYNLYLNDGFFKTYQNPHVSIKQFPSGFTDQYYILSVAGAGGHTPTPPPSATNNIEDIDDVDK